MMNWLACASLVALVAACSFSAAEARMFRCHAPEIPWAKSIPVCLYDTEPEIKSYIELVQALLSDPYDLSGLQALILSEFPDANITALNEIAKFVLRLWCTDVDTIGGVSEQYEFDDSVQPICQTIVYAVELKMDFVDFAAKVLIRGPWGAKDSNEIEQENLGCYKMCTLFKETLSMNISGLSAGPVYLGCWLKENQNNEEISADMFQKEIDCERWNIPTTAGTGTSTSSISKSTTTTTTTTTETTTRAGTTTITAKVGTTTTTAKVGTTTRASGGAGLMLQWVLIAAGAVAFWAFKMC